MNADKVADSRIIRGFIYVLQLIMQLVVAVCGVNFVFHGFMKYENFHIFETFYIVVPICIFYCTNLWVKNGKMSTFIHFAATLSILFVIQGSMEDVFGVFVPGILLMVYSMKRKSEEPVLVPDMGIIVFCGILGGTIPVESGTVIPLWGGIMYISSYAIWCNLHNLNEYILTNGKMKSFNGEQAINVNSVMIAIFVAICGLAMFVATKLGLLKLAGYVMGFVRDCLIWLIGKFKSDVPENTANITENFVAKPDVDLEPLEILGMGGEVSNTYVVSILDMLLLGFGCIVTIWLLVLVIRAIMNLKYEKSNDLDVKEFIKPRFNISAKHEKMYVGDSGDINVVRNVKFKIRKLYCDLINKKRKKGQAVDSKDTPTEITTSFVGWNGDSEKITKIYEKARYSNEPVSADEVNTMREYCKSFR